jgi:hypothetical protein
MDPTVYYQGLDLSLTNYSFQQMWEFTQSSMSANLKSTMAHMQFLVLIYPLLVRMAKSEQNL